MLNALKFNFYQPPFKRQNSNLQDKLNFNRRFRFEDFDAQPWQGQVNSVNQHTAALLSKLGWKIYTSPKISAIIKFIKGNLPYINDYIELKSTVRKHIALIAFKPDVDGQFHPFQAVFLDREEKIILGSGKNSQNAVDNLLEKLRCAGDTLISMLIGHDRTFAVSVPGETKDMMEFFKAHESFKLISNPDGSVSLHLNNPLLSQFPLSINDGDIFTEIKGSEAFIRDLLSKRRWEDRILLRLGSPPPSEKDLSPIETITIPNPFHATT